VATAAGELAKDEKHLAAVEKMGADFIPLIVETLEYGLLMYCVICTLLQTEPPPVVVSHPNFPEGTSFNNCLLFYGATMPKLFLDIGLCRDWMMTILPSLSYCI